MKQPQLLEKYRQKTRDLVAELITEKLAEYCRFSSSTEDPTSFDVLTSPDAFSRRRVLLIISGIPEEAGVWSYTLLQQGRTDETFMRPYFELARRIDWGIIALNPHAKGIEGDSTEYHRQLGRVLGSLFEGGRAGIVVPFCFSAGGAMLLTYLNKNADGASNIASIILADTTPPPLMKKQLKPEVRALIDKSILFGCEDENQKIGMWAAATSAVLGLKIHPVKADLHGAVPNLLLNEVEQFLIQVGGQ